MSVVVDAGKDDAERLHVEMEDVVLVNVVLKSIVIKPLSFFLNDEEANKLEGLSLYIFSHV